MVKRDPNQLDVRLMGVNGLNPWDGADSASRKQMWSSQIGQHLVFSGLTQRRHQTGMEQEYGKYTFATEMPHDGEIIRTIDLYRKSYDYDSIQLNPLTVVIYERVDTREVGCVFLNNFFSQHPYFGFDYKRQPSMGKLRPGNLIKKGEVFLDSPGITPDGGYMFGAEVNVAFMTHPAVSEDGILISEDVCPNFKIKTYERRTVEWGNKRFALNTYGDEKHPRPFPDIGDYVREDGVLMALREYDDELAVVEQNVNSLREVDYIFDRITYVPANTRGRVVDIRIHHDPNAPSAGSLIGMDEQGLKYDRKRRDFYQAILDEYNRIKRERGASFRVSPEFNRLARDAISVVGRNTTAPNEPIRKLHRQAPLDQWRVEFVIEYEIVPHHGFKLSDSHGGKKIKVHLSP